MVEIFVVIGVALAIVLVDATRRKFARYEDIRRRLLSIEYKVYSSRNYIGMSQITPHGPEDRDTYIQMADTEMLDALLEVRSLKRKVSNA